MAVTRIVADLAAEDVQAVAHFYRDLLGLDVLMDQGWIVTLGQSGPGPIQLSIMSKGGGGAPVPALSIEVTDVDEVHLRAQQMGCTIAYPLTREEWGVRRFFVEDPAGRLINILTHL